MAKTFKATWLGDADPNSQFIRMGDNAFVKGTAVSISEDDPFAERIKGNPAFAIDDSKAEPIAAIEPNAEEQEERGEEGTEKAALKKQLRDLGVDTRGNASVETLRTKLVEATK